MNALIRMKNIKPEPLVKIEDISIKYGDEIITYCSLSLYGTDIPRTKYEPAHIEVDKVTIGLIGEEVEIDNHDIADYLVSHHYENK